MDAARETERVATTLARQGFVAVPDVVPSVTCDRLVAALDDDIAVVGSRNMLHWHGAQTLVAAIRSHPLLTGLLGEDRVAVQCTYFQKSAQMNWLVPLHQDLSIPVQERVAHASLKGWSLKEGGACSCSHPRRCWARCWPYASIMMRAARRMAR